MFERFTRPARRAVTAAVEEAERRSDRYIGTEHLLAGLTRTHAPVAAATLRSAGVTIDAVRAAMVEHDRSALSALGIDVDRSLVSGEPAQATPSLRRRFANHRPFTGGAKDALNESLHEARRLGQRHLGPEHVLLALTAASSTDPAVRLLDRLNVDVDDLRSSLTQRMQRAPDNESK